MCVCVCLYYFLGFHFFKSSISLYSFLLRVSLSYLKKLFYYFLFFFILFIPFHFFNFFSRVPLILMCFAEESICT